ncbi:hypothetical protein C8Q76DRAFT_799708 [Earliella scabrosa]|nr:hypothetical protein C8Q76DRAFT_799708 [Earliella scabrosa]
MRLWYYLFPLFVAHIPLLTFFDFNAVFILLSVARFRTVRHPVYRALVANGPVYEVVNSFVRRSRVWPLDPAHLLFFRIQPRRDVFLRDLLFHLLYPELRLCGHGSLVDGLASTSTRRTMVTLLMPRAAPSMALLSTFSSPEPGAVALANRPQRRGLLPAV